MRDQDFAGLDELDNYQLVDKNQDVRGRPLVSVNGEKLGVIQRMLVDKGEERIAALVLEDGRVFPIEEVAIRSGKVVVEGAGAVGTAPPSQTDATEEAHFPVVEEEMAVGKREVERGAIRVHSRVIEEPVHEQIRLREEHVEVERRPVNQPVQDAEGLLREGQIEVTETAEEAVIGKRAVVKEEVVIRKNVDERVENIDDTIRRTEVDIERAPAPPRSDKV